MALRLYHRRSSTSKGMATLSPGGLMGRPRSQSLFPGGDGLVCLTVPQPRSRSHSFGSGSVRNTESLTSSEEENVFRWYVRVMYVILGCMAAVVVGLVFYSVKHVTQRLFQ